MVNIKERLEDYKRKWHQGGLSDTTLAKYIWRYKFKEALRK